MQRGKKFSVVAYGGTDPESKRERRKWFSGFVTRKEAEQFRLTLAHHPTFGAGQGPYCSPRLRTGDYLKAWLRERETLGTLRVRTVAHSETVIRLHLAPYIGHIPLARLSPSAIQALYVTLLERGLSPATVRRATGILHVALEEAVKRGFILRNPQDNTTAPRVPRYEPAVPDSSQIAAYLADARATATPALYGLYVVAATCGLRIGELTGLSERAADLPARVLHVRQTLVRAGKNPLHGQPKTENGCRTILLPDMAVEAIRDALRWKKEQRLRRGPKYRDSGFLFVGEYGRPLNPSNIRNRDHLPRLVRLKMTRFRLHDMRHFHATQLVAAGVDYRTVGDRLGHRSPSFTLSVYAHAAARAQEQAATVANGLLTELAGVTAEATAQKH
ncbi:MAG TPA: tyrosine-type recombinase/integrase [Steroidobacteraceae bacterium]|nr:tyrosine-type recombinase/integrase [Steroidobacteraceae bacterium]